MGGRHAATTHVMLCCALSRPSFDVRLRCRHTQGFSHRCTFSLLGEEGEGVVFSRPLRVLRAA